MNIITRKYRVYKFKELKEEAQDQALEKLSDINFNHDSWYEDDYLLDSNLPKKIQMAKKLCMFDRGKKIDCLFEWKRIYFDLDRANYLSFEDLKVVDDELFRKFLRVPLRYWKVWEWKFDNSGDRERNTILEFLGDNLNDKIIERAEDIFADLVSSALKDLRKSYDYLGSREAVIETIEANEYRFLKDGTIFN